MHLKVFEARNLHALKISSEKKLKKNDIYRVACNVCVKDNSKFYIYSLFENNQANHIFGVQFYSLILEYLKVHIFLFNPTFLFKYNFVNRFCMKTIINETSFHLRTKQDGDQ